MSAPSARDKSPVRWDLCWPMPMPCASSTETGPVCWQELWGVRTAMSKLMQSDECYTKFTQEANAASSAPDQQPWPREVGLIKHVQTGRKHCKSGEWVGRNSLPLCPEYNWTKEQCVCGSWEMYVQLAWFKGIDALSKCHCLRQWQTPDASKVVAKALWGKQLWNELTWMQISLPLSWGRRLKQEFYIPSNLACI